MTDQLSVRLERVKFWFQNSDGTWESGEVDEESCRDIAEWVNAGKWSCYGQRVLKGARK